MAYEALRARLTAYYFDELPAIAEDIRVRVYARMEAYRAAHPEESAYLLKAELYRAIADEVRPRLFEGLPYFCETGALVALSDGKFNRGAAHANGWLYETLKHRFIEADPEGYERYRRASGTLFPQTGLYVDMMHAGLPFEKLFRVGLRGVLAEIGEAERASTDGETAEFLASCRAGILALARIAERFAEAASACGMDEIAATAARVPWDPPATYREGLAAMAFLRKALGSLEGIGFSSFGRVDVLLAPLYEADLARGVTHEELLADTELFMLYFDAALNTRDRIDTPYGFDLENSLTLGGCDREGREVFNGVTRLFFEARTRNGFLYPKMMFRYSSASSDEYLRLVTSPLLEGKSFSLFENDDAIIPALVRSGIDLADARSYAVGGCWDVLIPDVFLKFSGEYLNILRLLEYAVHGDGARLAAFDLPPLGLEEAADFEELYRRLLDGIAVLLRRKAEPMSVGGRVWHRVNPMGALSALMTPCLPSLRDITAGGGRYNRESVYFCGFSEILDSLLAIRRLCFTERRMTVAELFARCRADWEDEALRREIIGLPSFGDGSEESSRLAWRFLTDLYRLSRDLPTAYGGDFRIGFNQFTEIIFWGKTTRALPNGRRSGDYICQGLTPTRLRRPGDAMQLLDSLRYMDLGCVAGNASLTLTLPAGGMDGAGMIAFMRMAARSGMQGIQPNCIDRETLLAAQKDPEHYGHIVVRVCGFSAPFVLLSEEYQNEILSRTYTEV